MRKKMLDKHPVCEGCGRSWDEVTHQAKGLCRGCYRKQQYKDNEGDKKREKWAKDYDCCQECGTTEVIHASNGLCRTCYSKQHRDENLEHYHEVEEIRRMQPHVIEYMRNYMAEYYPANKGKWLVSGRKWRTEKHDDALASWARYREANRGKCRESYRKWYEANPEKSAAQGRKWRKENPEKARQHNRDRRAKKAGLEGIFTESQFVELCEAHNFQCYHCGTGPADGNALVPDHLVPVENTVEGIIPSNDIDNIGPLCVSCNSSKSNMPLFDFDIQYLQMRAEALTEEGKVDHCVVQLFNMTKERKVELC